MRIRLVATACLGAVALALAGCSSGDTPFAEGPQLPPSESQQQSAPDDAGSTVDTNERGHIVKELGEEAGFGSTAPNDPSSVSFVLDEVEADPACHQYGQAPKSGHTLLLHFRVATGDDPKTARMTSTLLNPFNFAEIDTNGVTHQAKSGMCTGNDNRLPHQYGVNQKYAGTIEIVVPEASGVLMLSIPLGNAGGWEWHY